jgi:hypothetical protein
VELTSDLRALGVDRCITCAFFAPRGSKSPEQQHKIKYLTNEGEVNRIRDDRFRVAVILIPGAWFGRQPFSHYCGIPNEANQRVRAAAAVAMTPWC